MKKFIMIIFLTIMSSGLYAQNLLSNGSFENFTSCPTIPAPPIAPNPFSTSISIDSLRFAELSTLIGAFYPATANAMQFASQPNIYLSDKHYYYAQNAYNRLKKKPDYRNVGNANDIVYNTFFNQIHNTNIGLCGKIEDVLFANKAKKAQKLIKHLQAQNYQEIIAYEVYSIYNKTWARHIYSFSPQDTATLLSIALMNPNGGGHAVYTARIMLGLDFVAANSNNTIIRKGKTSIEPIKEKKNNLLVYPNPAKDLFNIEMRNKEILISRISITNLLGQKVYDKYFGNSYKVSINTSSFEKGIYLIKVIGNNNSYQSKLIIQ